MLARSVAPSFWRRGQGGEELPATKPSPLHFEWGEDSREEVAIVFVR